MLIQWLLVLLKTMTWVCRDVNKMRKPCPSLSLIILPIRSSSTLFFLIEVWLTHNVTFVSGGQTVIGQVYRWYCSPHRYSQHLSPTRRFQHHPLYSLSCAFQPSISRSASFSESEPCEETQGSDGVQPCAPTPDRLRLQRVSIICISFFQKTATRKCSPHPGPPRERKRSYVSMLCGNRGF